MKPTHRQKPPFRYAVPCGLAALALIGCQAPNPAVGQLALNAASGPASRVLANATSAFSSNVTTLAGTGTAGFVEGPAATARFNAPQGIAVDPAGNVHVADSYNMAVRTISPAGLVMTAGFPMSLGKLMLPTALAVMPNGLAVMETSKNRIQVLQPATGTVTPFAGGTVLPAGQGLLPGSYGHADGLGAYARFESLGDICVAPTGAMYISDRNRIRMALPNGTVSTIAGIAAVGHVNGPGDRARFNTVKGIAVDPQGRIVVVDAGNHRIRRLTPHPQDPSQVTVETVAGSEPGYADSSVALGARFYKPTDIAVDAIGNLYVTDSGNHRVRKILTDGSVITLAGSGYEGRADGPGGAAAFNYPNHIAVDAAGNVYVTDLKNHAVRKIEQI